MANGSAYYASPLSLHGEKMGVGDRVVGVEIMKN